jgi:uncharacterized protein
MNIQNIFLDNLGNIRSGWRVVLFLLVLFAVSSIVFYLASLILADLAFYAPLILVVCLFIASAIMVKLFEKRPLHSVGIPFHRRMPLEIAQGVIIGGAMMSLVFLTQYAAGWIELEWRGLGSADIFNILAFSLLMFILAGFGEELFFRGYPFQTLAESIKAPVAVVLMSVAFAAAHATNPNISPLGFFNIFLAGVWLSVAYLKTRTLWFPTGLHVSWNFFQGTIFSYPVSGQMFADKSLFVSSVSGPVLMTGGDFGPEGGLLSTVVLIVGTVYIYKSKYFLIGEGVWTVERYIRQELERIAR